MTSAVQNSVSVVDTSLIPLSSFEPADPVNLLSLSLSRASRVGQAGMARKKYMELAEKDGEEEVEERYGLPNLYAQGTSKNVRAFNCVQRSHQHILETFTQALATGLIAAVHYPVTAAVSSLAYAVGRVQCSRGYACGEGDPSKRFSLPFSTLVWYGLLSNIVLSLLSSVAMLSGKKLL